MTVSDKRAHRRRSAAYVTGGTRGIGQAIAECLSIDYDVTVCGSSEVSVASFREKQPAIRAEKIDILEDGAISAAIARAHHRDGGLRVLVCCAGAPVLGNAETLSLDDWDHCMNLNLRSAFVCAKAAIPLMGLDRDGVIIFVSSIWAQATPPDRVAYATSKAALTTLARTLALDHAKDGIRVNCVAPGFVDTDLLRNSIANHGDRAGRPDDLEALRSRHPLGRLIEPDDVANAVAFLTGPGARNITAQTLYVDGGIATALWR
ncbi:SDR family NAD(P)-dependent oxidoreductase [Mesorhizobium sp. A623]